MPKNQESKGPEREWRKQRQEVQKQLELLEDRIDEAAEGEDVSELEAEYERLRQQRAALMTQEHQARRTRIDEKKRARRRNNDEEQDGA